MGQLIFFLDILPLEKTDQDIDSFSQAGNSYQTRNQVWLRDLKCPNLRRDGGERPKNGDIQ